VNHLHSNLSQISAKRSNTKLTSWLQSKAYSPRPRRNLVCISCYHSRCHKKFISIIFSIALTAPRQVWWTLAIISRVEDRWLPNLNCVNLNIRWMKTHRTAEDCVNSVIISSIFIGIFYALGPMVWYQMFEYAIGHWLQKATEHMIGCVLCSPGCFSLFRGKALMDDSVMRKYTTASKEARHYVQYDQGTL
jgi:hypothetical protein